MDTTPRPGNDDLCLVHYAPLAQGRCADCDDEAEGLLVAGTSLDGFGDGTPYWDGDFDGGGRPMPGHRAEIAVDASFGPGFEMWDDMLRTELGQGYGR